MRILASSLAVAALIVSSAGAFAAGGMTATGAIKAITAKSVTLADGAKYELPKKFDISTLKKGEKVDIEYMKSGKMLEATSIKMSAADTMKPKTMKPKATDATKPATTGTTN
jgi:hypothetical protein